MRLDETPAGHQGQPPAPSTTEKHRAGQPTKTMPTVREAMVERLRHLAQNPDERQARFYQWQAAQAKPVLIVSARAFPSITAFLRAFRPDVSDRYLTAYSCAEQVKGVGIVHGYTSSARCCLPVPHAWNVMGGVHFDVTATNKQIACNTYLRIIEITVEQYVQYQSLVGHHRSVLWPYFCEHVLNQKATPEPEQSSAPQSKITSVEDAHG